MTNDRENCIWIPIPLEIDDEDGVFEELARLEKSGIPHRIFRYRKGTLIKTKN
jgi:hypothetical protein